MKTSAALCFLIVMVSVQSNKAQFGFCDFEVHLENSEHRFVRLAASNPDLALNVSAQDLTQALTIAAELFNRSEITPEEAVDEIMQYLTDIFNATLLVPRIHNTLQDICNFLEFSFPAAITDEPEFERFIQIMTRRIFRMCTDLGIGSFAADIFFLSFQIDINSTIDSFVAQAASSPTQALALLATGLSRFLNIARSAFDRGVLTAPKASELIFQFLSESLLPTQEVPEIFAWVSEACQNRTFPFSEAIIMEGELRRFTTIINSKLPMLCSGFGVDFGTPN